MISTRKKNFEKKYSSRLVSIIVTCALAILCLAGCDQVRLDTASKDALITVDKTTLTKEEGIYRLLEQKTLYEGDQGQDIWSKKIGSESMGDYVKEAVFDELVKYTASVEMADKLGIYMTDEDKSSAAKAAEETYDKVSSSVTNSKYNVSLESARQLYIKKATFDKVYEKVTSEVGETITEDSTKVILVNYVRIPTSDGSDLARGIRDNIKNGVPFEEACSQAGYQAVINEKVYPKTMSSNFESVAFALVDGELSEVVEGKNEMFIIQCLDDRLITESLANYNKTLTETKNEKFNDYYINFASEHKLSVNKNYWNKIKVSGL